jgi:hypothetical protein
MAVRRVDGPGAAGLHADHDLIDMHLMGWLSLREWDGLLSQRVGL